jgi:hypothetical protein
MGDRLTISDWALLWDVLDEIPNKVLPAEVIAVRNAVIRAAMGSDLKPDPAGRTLIRLVRAKRPRWPRGDVFVESVTDLIG